MITEHRDETAAAGVVGIELGIRLVAIICGGGGESKKSSRGR